MTMMSMIALVTKMQVVSMMGLTLGFLTVLLFMMALSNFMP